MSDDPKDKAAREEPRLHFDDEAGEGPGKRDIAGLVIAVSLFGLAAVVFNDATGYEIRRSYARCGPEIVPYLIAAGIAMLAVVTVFMAWRGKFEARERMNFAGISWLFGGILAQIAMIYGGAGFIIASAVLFACAARVFGQLTLLLNLAVGAVLSTLLFLLFFYGLGMALPSGQLERMIDLLLR